MTMHVTVFFLIWKLFLIIWILLWSHLLVFMELLQKNKFLTESTKPYLQHCSLGDT